MKLHLIIKKKWADAILFLGKKEEYRSNTPYYQTRILKHKEDIKEVVFHVGYTKKTFTCTLSKLPYIGLGKPIWGAPYSEKCIILSLGDIIAVDL